MLTKLKHIQEIEVIFDYFFTNLFKNLTLFDLLFKI